MKGIVSGIAAVLGMGCTSAETVEQAQAWVSEGAVLVDVRSPGEFAGGHVRGALNIPVGELERRVDEIQSDRVVVYCQSGIRSARAARALEARGKTVVDIGGIGNWPHADDIVTE